ncbi:MAG: regulator of sigma E protease [Verrucomicrobiales bacterium]|jgi:regulator of sigma E protease
MEIFLSVLQAIGVIALVILVFNLIIVVHELGHFLAARWRGLEIEKFQIWFGKPLWKKTINGVQYGLGSIPAGGFVALPQMAPMELLEGKSGAKDGLPLKPIKPLDKIIVAFAGPLFSFMLAIVFACIVYFVGIPDNGSKNTEIGWVAPDSPAAQAGVLAGDKIEKIDGTKVKAWSGLVDSVMWLIIGGTEETVNLVVDRDGEKIPFNIKPEADRGGEHANLPWYKKIFKRPPTRKIGVAQANDKVQIREVLSPSPIADAGVQGEDIILAWNGEKVRSLIGLEVRAQSHGLETPDESAELTVLRGEETLTLEITPRPPVDFELPEKEGEEVDPNSLPTFLGVAAYGSKHFKARPPKYPTPPQQIKDTFKIMHGTISAVTSSKSGVSVAHLNGPLGIMNLYYTFFRSPDGFRLVLWFSVILNINLAILNMLPLPILDGGHIMMATFEAIFRRPIHIKVLEIVNGACALLLLSFIGFITLKDSGDIRDQHGPAGEAPAAPRWEETTENSS